MIIIFNYIKGFFSTITSALSALYTMITAVLNLLKSCIGFLFDIVGVLPTAFTVSLIALISIAIIYKILGREGQD